MFKLYMDRTGVHVCFLFVQVFCVPVEERRFKEMMEQQFGEKGGTQAKICSNIMAETGTACRCIVS